MKIEGRLCYLNVFIHLHDGKPYFNVDSGEGRYLAQPCKRAPSGDHFKPLVMTREEVMHSLLLVPSGRAVRERRCR